MVKELWAIRPDLIHTIADVRGTVFVFHGVAVGTMSTSDAFTA